MATATTVDEYVSAAPIEVRDILERIRQTIREAVPDIEERISYQIPTFSIGGRLLIYVAAWKHHISIYPAPVFDDPIDQELEPYRAAKSTVQFPLKQEIPYSLISRMVAMRLRRQSSSE